MKICDVKARQIYDSRGIPTIEVCAELDDGSIGVGSAPSGASTGSHEAHEKRDGGKAYAGKGVSLAIEGINGIIRGEIIGMDAWNQQAVDMCLCSLDGSENKSKLGGNAAIAVSWAVADAAAKANHMPLFRYLGGLQGVELPCPMFNVINGGRHADNNLEIQEFMFVPVGASSFHEAMRMGSECYHALKTLLHENGFATAVGDEGGFAPDFERDEQALEWMLRAIEASGWRAGEDVCLALDCAASEWADDEGYLQPKSKKKFHRDELIETWQTLAGKYPLVSIEDPLGEEDFEGFYEITHRIGGNVMIVGDDLFTTNAARLHRGIAMGAGNAILIKPNQIGTVSETLETIRLAGAGGYDVIVSHRSGETTSSAIADLAVAVNAPFIKAGAPARGERLAKYNRLMEIENMLE